MVSSDSYEGGACRLGIPYLLSIAILDVKTLSFRVKLKLKSVHFVIALDLNPNTC